MLWETVPEKRTGQELAYQCLAAAMQLGWKKQLKANKYCFQELARSHPYLWFTFLVNRLLNCLAETYHHLGIRAGKCFWKKRRCAGWEQCCLSGLAGSYRGFFPLRGDIDYLEREIPWKKPWFTYMLCTWCPVAMISKTNSFLVRNLKLCLVGFEPQKLCLFSSPYTSSFRLSPLLRHLKGILSCLYLGLWLSVDLGASHYQLTK